MHFELALKSTMILQKEMLIELVEARVGWAHEALAQRTFAITAPLFVLFPFTLNSVYIHDIVE